MRIALLGPSADDIGGLASRVFATILGLAAAGHDIEVFVEGRGAVPAAIAAKTGIRMRSFGNGWEFDRWYSRTNTAKLITGTGARVLAQRSLVAALCERHLREPFDVVYRLSTIELFTLGSALARLPPLVVHPGTHAAGELRWHWRERHLALQQEPRSRFGVQSGFLATRAAIQLRDLPRASAVIALSQHFAAELERDYRIRPERLHVVPNPIDLNRFKPEPATSGPSEEPVRVLFVAHMSVRKGVEQIVALTHRLGDLAGRLMIECVGGARLFSDYRHLLRDLNPLVASYRGGLSRDGTTAVYQGAGFALQPSWYEPFGNSVGEALASGIPVITSREVGASEGIDPRVARTHESGDLAMLELHVRALLTEVEAGAGPALAALARTEAQRRFSIETVTDGIIDALAWAAER